MPTIPLIVHDSVPPWVGVLGIFLIAAMSARAWANHVARERIAARHARNRAQIRAALAAEIQYQRQVDADAHNSK